MKYYITGQNGLIARNLKVVLESLNQEVVTDGELFSDAAEPKKVPKTGEACIWQNSEDAWYNVLYGNDIDVVVHNAAVVGTDVVALNPQEAVLSNVQGTHNIVRAANRAKAAVCYLGTTVIYDTKKYQEEPITEESSKHPRTYYGIQKLAAEQIVTTMADRWTIVRPLFAFGGLGDMNSLIAKSIYAHLNGKEYVDMFLDPSKVKDYLHVTDFCKAIAAVCRDPMGPGWGTDWNVAAETPVPASEVMSLVDEAVGAGVSSLVRWHPRTDYLGNHRLSSQKIREKLGWKPELDLLQGIRETLEWIKSAENYNPLKYLDEAAGKKVDLLQHFPK
jgi:nucleoside-diphosphate-sugar epimerase